MEQVVPKTFEKALERGKPVELRFNHGRVLGSTKDGALQLTEDAIGLRARAVITDAEVMAKARNHELRGWSFGFKKLDDRWEEFKSGIQRRYLDDIELREVSLLDCTPAYIATSVEERGEDCDIIEERSQLDEPEVLVVEQGEKKTNIMAELRFRRLKLGGKK